MRMKKKFDHKKLKIHDPALCKECFRGSCCRWGVETDLLEVAQILEKRLDIPKPWFEFLGRDKSFPSGYKFSTLLKNRRCIFQDDNMRCRIYEVRPRFCSEFPLEDGKRASYYDELCHHARAKKKKKKKGR
ncbi:MAG: YkgJ family cysteine cluster protein [Candidatus Omnitrophica bacterium]|nr:YkgJ family cysteine cluster protein [Candidatus Omnitrophota bacterium]